MDMIWSQGLGLSMEAMSALFDLAQMNLTGANSLTPVYQPIFGPKPQSHIVPILKCGLRVNKSNKIRRIECLWADDVYYGMC